MLQPLDQLLLLEETGLFCLPAEEIIMAGIGLG